MVHDSAQLGTFDGKKESGQGANGVTGQKIGPAGGKNAQHGGGLLRAAGKDSAAAALGTESAHNLHAVHTRHTGSTVYSQAQGTMASKDQQTKDGSTSAAPGTSQDDYQSTRLVAAICRSVQTRVEDIHLIKQTLDVKLRKTRHINVDLFEDVRGRETARITKENAQFQSLLSLKQSDSAMTRRQLIKHAKKIHQVFWNVVEAEEEAQDLAQIMKHGNLYMTSELNLLEIYNEKGDKVQVFKRGHAIQAKLLEAVLREKDFEVNFSVALGVQKAR